MMSDDSGKLRRFAWMILIIAAMVALPYLVFYVIPFLTIAAAIGFLWFQSCHKLKSERQYARLSALIPATVIMALSLLNTLELGALNEKMENRKGRVRPALIEVSPDHWYQGFNSFHYLWYGWLPFLEVSKSADYDFRHVRWVVLSAMLAGAPMFFFVLYRQDTEEITSEAGREAREREYQWDKCYRSKCAELEGVKREFGVLKHEFQAAFNSHKNEIELLRAKDRHSTDDKKELSEDVPEKPDLDIL